MAIFYIAYGEDEYEQAAEIKLCIRADRINIHLAPHEGAKSLAEDYEQDDTKKHLFPRCSPSTSCPGQHSVKYQMFKWHTALAEQLDSFLKESTKQGTLDWLPGRPKSQAQSTMEPAVINHHASYFRCQEVRMEMQEWIQNCTAPQGGTHYPLCVKFKNVPRRSRQKEQERWSKAVDKYYRTSRTSDTSCDGSGKRQTGTNQHLHWQRLLT